MKVYHVEESVKYFYNIEKIVINKSQYKFRIFLKKNFEIYQWVKQLY